jgi:hypothetical protein
MTRIILVSPITAQRLLGMAVRLAVVKTIAILALNAVLRFMLDDMKLLGDEHPVMGFLNQNIYPLIHYPLWLGGIDTLSIQDSILTGTSTLLLIVLIWPATLLAQYGGRVIAEYNERLASGSAITGQPHMRWFLTACALSGLALMWRLQSDPTTMDLPEHFYYLLRLSFIFMAGVGSLSCLYIAYSLQQYIRRTSPKIPKLPKSKVPKLRVVSETKAPKASPRPASAQRALLVALAAELIQFSGRESRLPTSSELAARLGPLLRAAQVTGAGVPSPGELESICQQTLTLLDKGMLKPLTNLKEAKRIYQKPGNHIDQIVTQLELHLKT